MQKVWNAGASLFWAMCVGSVLCPPRRGRARPALPRHATSRRAAPRRNAHAAHVTCRRCPQAKEMLLMAEEAVGDRKLEGRLTLRQLRRYFSSSLRDGAQQGT